MADPRMTHPPFCLPTLLLLLSLLSLVSGSSRPDLPFIGCAAPEGNTQRCYFYVQEEKTWDEANKACSSHEGAYLATVPDYQTRIFLSEAARPRQNGVWIGGVKELQHNWRWNTGRPYLHNVIENRTEPDAELCSYVNVTHPTILQTAPCTNRLKYICSESELSSIHDPHYVSQWKHTWIWFSAKIDCLNRGMDLAVVKDDNLDIFQQLLKLEPQQEENARYWVGLSTSRYIWEHTGKEMEHILFGCGEPSHSSERCIEMLADGKYNDTRCEEKRPYICEWVNRGHEMLDLGCLDNRCFYYVKEPMSWGQANSTCGLYSNTFLASIPDYHTQFYLNSMVTKLYLTKPEDQSTIMGRTIQVQNGFWIGGRFIFDNNWKFMDGEIYNGEIFLENKYTYYHCGAVRVGDADFHGLLCDDKCRFLCLTTDPKADVTRKGNYFISSAQTQVLDWFEARTNCLDRGMDLASGSMELLQQILTGETGSFWIGLLQSKFVWEHNKKPITHLQFRCDEPNNYLDTDEHCVEMWLDGEYNDNICAALKPSVCEWDRKAVIASSTKPPFFRPKITEPKDHKWMIAAIAGFIGWVVAIISIAFSVKMYKKYSDVLTLPRPNYTIELENENDPTLCNLLSGELKRILLNAAPYIHEHLPLSTDTILWAILRANNVVNQANMESIRGNHNSRNNVEQVAALLEHLQRGTNRRYYYFRAALRKAGYSGVVRHYLDHPPGSPSTAAPVSPSPCAVCGGSGSSHFPFPPTTTNPVDSQGGKENGECSSSAIKQSDCQSDSISPSVWSRLWRFLRSLLPDPSKSHSSTKKDNNPCLDEESYM